MSSETVSGIQSSHPVHMNLSVAALAEAAIENGEGLFTNGGALVTRTGKRTGRSPKDRFFVAHGESKDRIEWGPVNQPIEPDACERLLGKARDHLATKPLYVVDGYVGADPAHRINLRVVTELAWHALFAKQLFRRPDPDELSDFEPEFTVVSAPTFKASPDADGTNTEVLVALDLEQKQVLIVGTEYAGEIKKSIFTSANYLLPGEGVLPMHCSANVGADGDVALFFGLSGTGKTTLSADPQRRLIGDDEHGWSDNGVFNFEGGCYAKCIDLSEKNEPQIWAAIKFGSVVENVVVDPETRVVDFTDSSYTENTRVAYPLEYIPGFVPEGRAGHAQTIVFLTADAFGVLPPISKLDRNGAMYHFLSGFTSKLAGTEAGMGSEPEATFSTCFGAPFLPLPPGEYARMLGEKIDKHDAEVYLVNTGWTGGPYGVGQRMSLPLTRAMVTAAVSGDLRDVPTRKHEIFNVDVPISCPSVPDEVLDPRSTWSDPQAYDEKARELGIMFVKNFERFVDGVDPAVTAAGPIVE